MHNEVSVTVAAETIARKMTVEKTSSEDNSITTSISQHTSPTAQLTVTTSNCNSLSADDYQQLLDSCREQAQFFATDGSEKGQRLYAAFLAWQDFIVSADELRQKIAKFAWKYDFDAQTPGNGYRSFITVSDACIAHGQNICRNLNNTRNTMFFRKKYYMKEVEACCQLLSSICTCLQYMLILHDWAADSNDLFGAGDHTAEELFELGDTINQYCFYGRCLGFQYGETIRSVMRFMSLGMVGFSEAYYAQADDGPIVKTTRSLWTGSKYLLNPELRARRVVNLSQYAGIDFCKSFWFLAESELMQKLPSIICSTIKVNRLIEIPAEPLQLPKSSDVNQNSQDLDFVNIPIPTAHLGPGLPVSCRLLSCKRREGMMGEGSGSNYGGWQKLPKPSKGIILHCHGGGFVAQSSKSHELYLREWAVALDVPILSVDYSLAPEAPFPRALEETFYAYCWMLKNALHLGTTAERVIVAGDSAGANLVVGVSLKAIELGVRVPDGMFLAYCPTLINFAPSPARLLCLMDPLLPFGFMIRCLRAYTAPEADTMQENSVRRAELNAIRQASVSEQHLSLASVNSSRRTSLAKSPLSSVAENSKWHQMNYEKPVHMNLDSGVAGNTEESSDTFASASSHSQTVERTEPPSEGNDNSSCVSFEDDSQPIEHYPVEITTSPEQGKKSEKSAQYIDKFLDKYILNEMPEQEMPLANGKLKCNGLTDLQTDLEENLILEAGKDIIALSSLQGRLNNAVSSLSHKLSRCTQSCEIRTSDGVTAKRHFVPNLRNIDALIARSPSAEFDFDVPKDPFLSPYWAPDTWLSQLPHTKILTVDMDPCLDDCVMFARKLKALGTSVELDILKGLPHGFLNFTMLSSEAMEGSKLCIKHLKGLLEMEIRNENKTSIIITPSKDKEQNNVKTLLTTT